MVLVIDVLTEYVTRKYTWGLDLSGLSGTDGPKGIHGAGGIGGLLAVEDVAGGGGSSNSYWYFYDANGNVGQLLKASDRSVAAHYEYDPYGQITARTGAYAAANPVPLQHQVVRHRGRPALLRPAIPEARPRPLAQP